jgi:hypothetical protein
MLLLLLLHHCPHCLQVQLPSSCWQQLQTLVQSADVLTLKPHWPPAATAASAAPRLLSLLLLLLPLLIQHICVCTQQLQTSFCNGISDH